jgi:hypothetical protein
MKTTPRNSVILALALATALARADTTVVFNEIMYHPATNEPALEWVELRNQNGVDVDVSGWSITGGIGFLFPSNSIVRGGGFALVAVSPATMIAALGSTNGVFGPFTNRLGNDGDTLRLRDNSGRVVDEISYGTEGDWPVAPDGSGASLAKRDRDTASGPAANWTWSEQMGGTPLADNFPFVGVVPPESSLVAVEDAWRYDTTGMDLGASWSQPGYIDTGWATGNGWLYHGGITVGETKRIETLFNTGIGTNGVVLQSGASDPHYTLSVAAQGTVGANALAMQNNAAWLANDTASSWIGVISSGANNVNFGPYGYLTRFLVSGFVPGSTRIDFRVSVDDSLTNVFFNGVPLGITAAGFGGFSATFSITNGFVAGTNTLDFRTLNGGTGANPAGFRAEFNATGLVIITNTPVMAGPTTHYLRKRFHFTGDPENTVLRLNAIADDGAVFYLNGVEVHRLNMPAGPVAFATPASTNVLTPAYTGPLVIPAASLVAGTNVLAVEVHQAAGGTNDMLFGASLTATPQAPPPVQVAFNEIAAATNAEFWLELANHGTNSYSLDGHVIVFDGSGVAGEYALPAMTSLPGGGFLALSNSVLGFTPIESGDKLYLLNPSRSRVLDAVVVRNSPRGRSPDGTGPFLRPAAPTPGTNNSFAFRTEIVINEIMYHHRDIPATNNSPARESPEMWIELFNRSSNTVNLTGWELDGGVTFLFTPGKMLAPGAYLLVADDANYLRGLYPMLDIEGNFGGRLSGRSDRIVLKDPSGNPADEVRYFDGGRWPEYADGGGSSLELRHPDADNSKAEAWAASIESNDSAWQTYTYRGVAQTVIGPAQWNDFICGLLAEGECLIDDISVVESPTNAPVQFIANGGFENGLTGWRVIGTHGRSRVIVDPDNGGNQVLHLVATGPQEHMHNHIEATYTGGRTVVNGREYEISFRAKWLAGNNLLNTRLYFNRVARTTALPVPALHGTPGAQNSRFEPNIGPTFDGFRHERVIPAAGEAVTVSVTANDPQGVALCEVFWSANGGAFSSAPMTNRGGGRFVGAIPGFAAATIVQFYVLAVDGQGAAATFPARGPDSGALYTVADSQAMLNLGHNLRIVLTPAHTALLHADTNVMSNDRLPGTVIVDEKRAHYDVGVRLKSSQRGRNDPARVGFHLTFPADDLLRGVHPVILIDRAGGGGRPAQEEILLRHMLLRAGGINACRPDLGRVIAPRSAQTGPAIFAPRFEDEYAETAFENGGDGTFFELELIYYPTMANGAGYKFPQPDSVLSVDFQDLGGDKENYRYDFIIKNHRDADDYSRFIPFAKTFSLNDAAIEAQAPQVMDVDAWLRGYALVSLCGVGDMYTYGLPHNWMVYQRPSDGKFVYFPWDMDFSFTRSATDALVGNSPASDSRWNKIVNRPANLRCYYMHLLDIINISFNSAYMAYWTDHYDNFTPGQNYAGDLAYIDTRANSVRGQIAAGGGNAPFTVATNAITTGTNLVTLTGTAGVSIKTILINGVEYPVTWSSVSAWTIRVPVSETTNVLNLVGYDLRGNLTTNPVRTVTVNYTGPTPPDPAGVVVINEIMYNPAAVDAAFLELFNTSSEFSFNLSGWRLNGLDYTFPQGTVLTNSGFLVLANNPVAYFGAYSNAPFAFDQFPGNLQNDGETVTLLRPGAPGQEVVVDKVRYEGVLPWGTNANGFGPSLQLIDAAQDNTRPSNWLDREPPESWRQASFSGQIQANNGTNLFLWLAAAGEVFIDDIVLTYSNQPAGPNFLQNGSFETPLTGPWIIMGTTNGTNHAGSQIVTGVSRTGSNSLRVVATGAGSLAGAGTNAIRQTYPSLPTNTLCTLTFWFRPGTNIPNLQVRTLAGSGFAPTPFSDTRPRPPMPSSPGRTNTVATQLPPYDPLWLNELLAENLAGPMDNAGEREPWIELYNSGTNTLSLDGYYLADNYDTNLTQWRFPAGSAIGPGEFKIIWADGETNETTMTQIHAGFRLNAATGSVALVRLVSSTPQITDYLTYRDLPADRSYGDFPDGQLCDRQQFYRVTPGGTNDNASPPLVVHLNEWLALNTTGLINTNNSNRRNDWIELYNPNPVPAPLGGFFLTDDLADPFQFEIPPGYVIPPFGFLLVWADNQTSLNTNPAGDLHASFALSQDGEAIGLFAADGTLIDAVVFTAQFADITEGRFPDGPGTNYFLATPTPRAPNSIWANRYPVLAPVPNQTVYLGQTLNLPIPASDPDAPPQTLLFSLDPGFPAGAMIHGTNGTVTWTPTAMQLGTNSMTVRVRDNGTPALSATNVVRVVVREGTFLSGAMRTPGGDFEFTVGAIPGKTYRVEWADALHVIPALTPWMQLGTNRLAIGSSLIVTDPIGTNGQRFYRVQQVD